MKRTAETAFKKKEEKVTKNILLGNYNNNIRKRETSTGEKRTKYLETIPIEKNNANQKQTTKSRKTAKSTLTEQQNVETKPKQKLTLTEQQNDNKTKLKPKSIKKNTPIKQEPKIKLTELQKQFRKIQNLPINVNNKTTQGNIKSIAQKSTHETDCPLDLSMPSLHEQLYLSSSSSSSDD